MIDEESSGPLEAEVEDEPSVRIAIVHEPQLDHGKVDLFKAFLEKEVFQSTKDVILHLAGVDYVNSIALGLISLAAVMCDKNGIRMVVVCAREEVLKLFVISGLYKAIKIANSLESARLKLAPEASQVP
ncbi:MAG: anti-sigma factor antagonist [Candidatus Riflebacteria bacterium]|nr:anti-sigma factor antagonist [Candidatus Riflebacteria bacterium]